MIKAVALSAFGGFLMIISLLFACKGQIDSILAGPTRQPVVNIFALALTQTSGDGNSLEGAPIYAVLLTVLFLFNNFLQGFNHFTITTRIAYALARDRGIPFSSVLSTLNPETKNPDKISIAVFILESVTCLLPFISPTAFAALLTISTVGPMVSYLIPISLRLYH